MTHTHGNSSGLSDGRERFSVAVTMTKGNPNGMNILTRLGIWHARSAEEAVGIAVQDAEAANPEHTIHCITKLPISPTQTPSPTPQDNSNVNR